MGHQGYLHGAAVFKRLLRWLSSGQVSKEVGSHGTPEERHGLLHYTAFVTVLSNGCRYSTALLAATCCS